MPRITGSGSVTRRLQRLPVGAVHGVSQALFAGGEKIKARASRLITQGAVSGKNHVPSSPGEPPNENTGHLRTNIRVTQPAPLRVQITSEADYAIPLERGTSKMAARPYMGPAARQESEGVKRLVNRAIQKARKDSR